MKKSNHSLTQLLLPDFGEYQTPKGEVVSEREIAKRVSGLAAESPPRFVAEVFAGVLSGREFDADVMGLYRKYKGWELKK
jgi:hypothetical protein